MCSLFFLWPTAFARFRFAGRSLMFAVVVLSIVVPVQTLIVPVYHLGQLSIWRIPTGQFFAHFFLAMAGAGLFIFLFRQQFIKLPRVLEEAAEIDGCGPIRTFFRIALPYGRRHHRGMHGAVSGVALE